MRGVGREKIAVEEDTIGFSAARPKILSRDEIEVVNSSSRPNDATR